MLIGKLIRKNRLLFTGKRSDGQRNKEGNPTVKCLNGDVPAVKLVSTGNAERCRSKLCGDSGPFKKNTKPEKSAEVARYEFDNRSRKIDEFVSDY